MVFADTLIRKKTIFLKTRARSVFSVAATGFSRMTAAAYDIIVVGAGIVGATFSAALKGSGLEVALVEPHPPAVPTPEWDARIYAISPGSARFLDELGVWQGFDAARIAPVYGMEISGDTGAQLEFDAYAAGLPQLAWIMESNRIQHGLWTALQQQSNLTLFAGARCAELDWSAAGARLALADGTVLQSQLIVAADGGNSWVRQQADIGVTRRNYGQLGVVANFECSRSHANIARQWFRPGGVLAWLPLPGRRFSMVWSTAEAHAQTLLALPGAELAERVAQAGGHTLGKLDLLGAPAAFPLALSRMDALVKPGLALIGDAAHGVHPLAGQGVNLGLRDARELAQVLRARGAASCGELPLLRRYERARKEDILTMQGVTDGLHTLFGSTQPGLARLRNTGLDLTNRLGLIKNLLIQHALV
ncbi:2-octaprenyl-3-methyl-6-methoxy-1,4-benzoquinol hydroxylase [Sulfuriferula multivorans]|uniref:2-octaprenyl-3-methyl-6-methoxy-1,4-benzoquinol hydroxylase n=2 Tax=Sulfuriferula multivorans TaxID=1559896 RepID=A0A401JE38_9PROT|nr:2-octaprenyl-3-methyl-6-methoxy-1,4-benzoquinol hydroxylase [Sulfuriferula multivorans]